MGDKNNFYVMDDAYIEEKYVKAEEERQRREVELRKQREIDETNALAEAEKKRKAADEARRKRHQEAEQLAALEAAKEKREKLDKLRKEKEAMFQDRLKKIGVELEALEEKQGGFIEEKLKLTKEQSAEESELKLSLQQVLEEKQKILDKEQTAKINLESHLSKARAAQKALEHEQATAVAKMKALSQERRTVQHEMLKFFENPGAALEAELKPQETNSAYPSAAAPSLQPSYTQPPYQPQPQPSYQPPPQPQMQPTYQPPAQPQNTYAPPAANPYAGFSFQPTQTGMNQPAPSQPQPQPTQSAPPKKDDLKEQIGMLDDLLKQGIMTKDEYQANKKEALRAAGVSESEYEATNGDSEVLRQIAQLDEYLKTGVLQKADYEDAKKRVLEDAKKKNKGGSSGASNPSPIATTRTTQVAVVVPQNKGPGSQLRITYQGKSFDVIVPQGVYAGQQFHAAIPI